MALQLAAVKQYIRATEADDDAYINSLIKRANITLAGAVDDFAAKYEKSTDFAEIADQVMLSIIQDLFDNRNQARDGGKGNDYGYTVRTLLLQLQTWGEVT